MGNFQSHPPPKCKEWNVRRSFGPGLVNRIKGSLLKQLSSAQNNFSLIIVSLWNIKEITPSSCGHKSELKGATFRCKLNLITLSHYLFADFTAGLRLTEVRIPNHVVRDSTARLECHYDLDGEALYSVKWYRDGLEFYRYVPRDMPPAFIYDQSGLTIDVSNTRLNCLLSDADASSTDFSSSSLPFSSSTILQTLKWFWQMSHWKPRDGIAVKCPRKRPPFRPSQIMVIWL